MAMLADAVHEIVIANGKLGGSLRHQEHRRVLMTPFLHYARQQRALSRSLADIPAWLVHMYAAHCITQGMEAGNLANIFSAIRVVLRAMGNDLTRACSNRQLGLPRRVRRGARRAHTRPELDALLKRASRVDEGLVYMIRLAELFGLRRNEALMCGKDLAMWLAALSAGKAELPLLRGAKNGRARSVEVLESRRSEAIDLVAAALAYCKARNFQLIVGRGNNLKSAIHRFTALARRIGMVGELSFHSLRYNYALSLADQLHDNGVPPYETLVRLSEALGHGPSRTAMIRNVYCAEISDRFKGCLRLKSSEAHRRSPAKKLPRAALRQQVKLRHAELSGFPVGSVAPSRQGQSAAHNSRKR
jgi:integrase